MSHYGTRTEETRDDWETPSVVFDALDREFGFELDACCLPDTAKAARFFTPEDDGLRQAWAPHTTWVNPPYGDALPRWIGKAIDEAERCTVVMLVPARTEVGWWRAAVESERCREVRLVYPRISFLQGGRPQEGNNHASSVIIMRPGEHRREFSCWTWRDERQADLFGGNDG